MKFFNKVASFVVTASVIIGATFSSPVKAENFEQNKEETVEVVVSKPERSACYQNNKQLVVNPQSEESVTRCIEREQQIKVAGLQSQSYQARNSNGIKPPQMLPGFNYPPANVGKIGYRGYYSAGSNEIAFGGTPTTKEYNQRGVNLSYGLSETVAVGITLQNGNTVGNNMFPGDKNSNYLGVAASIRLRGNITVGVSGGRSGVGNDISISIQGSF